MFEDAAESKLKSFVLAIEILQIGELAQHLIETDIIPLLRLFATKFSEDLRQLLVLI